MKNDNYHRAKKKARKTRLKKRIEKYNTPIDINTRIYDTMSISELMNMFKDSLDKLNKDLKK